MDNVPVAGLQLWKRNLQLLVPFLVNPRIDLLSMKQLQEDEQGAQKIQVGLARTSSGSSVKIAVYSICGASR